MEGYLDKETAEAEMCSMQHYWHTTERLVIDHERWSVFIAVLNDATWQAYWGYDCLAEQRHELAT